MAKGTRLVLGTVALALLGDLATKWMVQSRFALYESVPVMPGVFLTYVMNPGAAFSMFATWSAAARLPIFFTVTAAAMWAAWHYFKSLPDSDKVSLLGLGLVVGGALGNLTDRVRYGMVVDFIEVGVRGVYTWPIFNVADSCVCVGVGLLIFRNFRPHASHPV